MDKNEFYQNLPLLEAKHLILRKLNIDDLQDIFDYVHVDEVTKYLCWNSHTNLEITMEYLHGVLHEYYTSTGSQTPQK